MARTTAKHPARTISPQHPDSVVLQGRSQQGAELGPEPGLPHTRPSSFEQCPPSPANQYSCPTPIQVPSLPLSPLVPGLYHLTSQLLNALYFLACKSVLPAPTLLTTGQAKLKKAPPHHNFWQKCKHQLPGLLAWSPCWPALEPLLLPLHRGICHRGCCRRPQETRRR